MKENKEKLDDLASKAPDKTDNLNSSSQAEMRSLSQQGKLNTVLDGKEAPIPSTFASAETLFAQGADIQTVVPKSEASHEMTHAKSAEKHADADLKPVPEANKDAGREHTEKYADGSTANIDKDGHLQKLTYANGQGYNYEWLKDKLVSVDSFDAKGVVKPWLEKNNDGTWTQFDEKQDQIWNADLSVNQHGDMQWTYKQSEFHKEGDIEINRTDGSHTEISKANHSWVTKYPDGQERKIVYDEKTNNPCEYWAPKPHSSHWKSSDGITWNQIGADGKPLNKPPMIGKFVTDNETGSFSFLNLGEKDNPHITAYDGTGQAVKQNGHDTAAAMVAGMVERYAQKQTSGGKTIPVEQFKTDSKNPNLSIDDRIAAQVLTKLAQDFQEHHIKQPNSNSTEVITAFMDMVKRAEAGDPSASQHIYEAMTGHEEKEKKKEDQSTELDGTT